MKLLPLVCLFVLAWSAKTLGDKTGSDVKKISVNEDDDIILPCSVSRETNVKYVFDWKKDGNDIYLSESPSAGQDGRISHFADQLENGNGSIKIMNTTMADSGNYTCCILLEPLKCLPKSQIELNVGCMLKDRTEEKNPGTCQMANIRIINQTNDGMLLQCAAQNAYPKPELELQDRAGVIVPAENIQSFKNGDNFDVILFATVIKTGNYHCVARQKSICHEVLSVETFVSHSGATSTPSGCIAASVFGALLVGVLLGQP